MPLAVTNGTTLHYGVTGTGPPLCLIAGFRQSSAAWPRPFIERLAARHLVVTFDNRGTGLSGQPEGGYGFRNQARDVAGLLDALRLPPVHLLGYSMGGAIAQEAVAAFPEHVARLVLFGTFCGGIWARPAPWPVLRRLFVTEGLSPEQAARQVLAVTYSPEYLAGNMDAVEQQMRRELEHPTPACVARKQTEALRKFDGYGALPSIRVPTLVATGASDLLVPPRNSEILASRIPGARLEMLSDLGHRAIWEAPEEMAELITDFTAASTGPRRAVA